MSDVEAEETFDETEDTEAHETADGEGDEEEEQLGEEEGGDEEQQEEQEEEEVGGESDIVIYCHWNVIFEGLLHF